MAERALIIHKADGPYLSMPCSKDYPCEVPVSREPAHESQSRGRVWQWIGSEDAPTIRPSVGCDDRCGQHRVITEGTW